MKTELTWASIKHFITAKDIKKTYNEGTQTARFTSKNQDQISDLNDWLLEYFPHYIANIYYDVNNSNGSYWLELICIRREVA